MSKPKILADAHIPYLKGYAEQFGEVEYLAGDQFTREAIAEKDALIVRTVTHFGEEILQDTRVRLICSATIGFDHIDTEYCDTHQIAWCTAPGCNADSVEQYITASLLQLAHKEGFLLSEKTIGIVGVGNVGSRVARACRKLGMTVLLNDPPRQEAAQSAGVTNETFVDLDEIKAESHIISFHTPLSKTGSHPTYHLADESFFESLGKKPFIVNSCRGSVVDNAALTRALTQGKVSGAVIDCWENEPNIKSELLRLAHIATPHIAGYSADGKWMATKMSLDSINTFFDLRIHPIKLSPLPLPPNPTIDLSAIAPAEQVAHAVWHTYNPLTETQQLKSEPDKFYWFRSHYPLRREYKAFRVKNGAPSVVAVLQNLGFEIE